MKNFLTKILIIGSLFTVGQVAYAALPAGFEVESLASGFNLPTTMAFTPDGRVFVAEKGGVVKVVKNGVVLPTPLITLTDVNNYGDRGLIGMAVDPNFATNGYVYLSYSYENTPGANLAGPKTARIVRIKVVGDTADESTKFVLVGKVGGTLATPSCENYAYTEDCIPSDTSSHSAGGLRFGPDGKLYASLGDGAHFDYIDTRALRAQNVDSLGGKILRINTDGTAPSDNPFYNGSSTSNRSKVYAYGSRNSFRFNFHPTTGVLYSGDVGWSSWEEINKVVKGSNYGWPCREGMTATTYGCTAAGYVDPIYTYAHDVNGAGCITGGAFATAYPAAYNNTIFFGDYAQNFIKMANISATGTLISVTTFMTGADGANGPVEFVRGSDGNIYFLSIYTGELRRIIYTTGNRQPVAQVTATPTNGLLPLSVAFSGTASTDPDGDTLTYVWNFGDNTATSTLASPSHTYTVAGTYNASLTVKDGNGGQSVKTVTITAGNQHPTGSITSPANASLYRINDTITASATGSDPEDGSLPDSAFQWTILLHHNTHTHTLQTATGKNTSFSAPDHAGATDVYTEVILTVTDSNGLTDTRSVNIYLNNNPVTTGNLILNPSLEDAVEGADGAPLHWAIAGFGTNDANYTYPVPGFEGEKAARVQINSYTNGDAKWGFEPVSVDPNTSYTFTGYYSSNATSSLTLQVGNASSTFDYYFMGELPKSTSWQPFTRTFTTPANARTVAIFHSLIKVGILDVDNYSLSRTSTPPPTDTTKPTVAITFPTNGSTVSGAVAVNATSSDNVGVTGVKFYLDNTLLGTEDTTAPYTASWNTASSTNASHTLIAVSRDAANNIATSTAVTVTVSNGSGTTTPPTSGNLFINPSVETVSTTTANTPFAWSKGSWGTNTTTFTHLTTGGFEGSRAVQINTTAYTSGDAKWFPNDVPVTPGKTYTFSHAYQSNATSQLLLRYTSTANAVSYVTLQATVPVSATWKTDTFNFTVPAGIKSVTAWHVLNKVGTLTTDLYSIVDPSATGTPSDTTKPTVAITFPTNGSTVSGAVAVNATSSDNVGVTGVKFYLDNTLLGTEDTTAPYTASWNTASSTNASHTLIAVSRDAANNIATSTAVVVTVNNVGGGGDTTAPIVAITSPTNGASVTGSIAVTASSSDNLGVVGVKFFLDGATLGVEDTVAPYSLNWNTATSSNGTHTLTAVSRDAANNQTTSSPVVVTVTGGVGTSSPNLIVNGNFETAGTGGNPNAWNQGGWGTNNRAFTYPSVGRDGNKAISLTITNYTDGDAKWYPNTVPLTYGKLYTFSDWYKGTTVSDVIGEYNMSDGTQLYFGVVKENQPTTTWKFANATFTPPLGAQSITFYHLISAVGTLEIDDMSLVISGNATSSNDITPPVAEIISPTKNQTVAGTVTLVASSSDNLGVTHTWFAIDGDQVSPFLTTSPYTFDWNSTTVPNGSHILKITTNDAAGNNSTATTTIIVNNTPDSTKPTVAITAPTNGSILSGSVNVTATSSDNIAVSGVKFYLDGAALGVEDTTAPYSVTWNTATSTNASHTLVAVSRDASNNIATSTSVVITVNNVGGGGDTTKPTVAITFPTNGSTVSGAVAVNATSSDNVGVTGVKFYLDNTLLGTEDTTAPYTASWNTASSTNASHTLIAVSRDAANNIATSTAVTVTVSNATGTSTPAGNLFANPSVEVASSTVPATPLSWYSSKWGTNTTTFTHLTTGGFEGARAVQINTTAYTSGDMKWLPTDVLVTPGKTYTFTHAYQSNRVSSIDIRYTSTTGAVSYVSLAPSLAASAAWKTDSYTFTVPAGMKSLTIMHLIEGVGTLTVDNYSLIDPTAVPSDTTKPTVAITAPAASSTVSGVQAVTADSSDNVGVSGVKFYLDNTLLGTEDTTAPYTTSWNTASSTNASHTLIAVSRDAANNIATSTAVVVTVNNSTSTPADTTNPAVAITAPANGSTVTGQTTITATASDNIGVAGVKFFLDGIQLGSEVTTTPYAMALNTASSTDGTHSINALARDLAGNTSSSTVSVTFSNATSSATTTPVNLISNGSLQTAGSNGLPLDWFQGGYGTNNAVFNYTASSTEGATQAGITITNYTDGDAKWFFKDVFITPLNPYVFSDYYESTVPTTLTVRYTMTNGSTVYVDIPQQAPAAAAWTQYSTTITPPAGAVSMTVFHKLQAAGTLIIDSTSLTNAGPAVDPGRFAQGMVSLTLDDGWLSQYQNALPILNNAGMKASFGIISQETIQADSYNVITNPSLEDVNGTTGLPTDWTYGSFGTNDATSTFPVQGFDGTKAAKVQITNYTDGDAKWFFNSVGVIPNNLYTFSDYYMSDATSTITVRYTYNDASVQLADLDYLPAQAAWTKYTKTFTVPANVASMTIYHRITSAGSLTIDNADLERVQIYVDPAQALNIQAAGHEISSHTQTHASLSTSPTSTMIAEVANSKSDLLGFGVNSVDTLIYPYGDYNDAVELQVKNSGYSGARSVDRGYNVKSTDKYALKIQQVDASSTPAEINTWIDQALADKTWLILMYHQVDNSGINLAESPADFQTTVNYLLSKSAYVVTMKQGLTLMNP